MSSHSVASLCKKNLKTGPFSWNFFHNSICWINKEATVADVLMSPKFPEPIISCNGEIASMILTLSWIIFDRFKTNQAKIEYEIHVTSPKIK